MPCLLGLLLPVPLFLQLATADPHLHRRPSDIHKQVWLSLLWGSLFLFPGSWCAQGFVCTLKSLWQVWVLILTWLHPFYHLVAASFLSLDVGYLFGRCQHPPGDGCSAASCNFGVLTGEDERTSLYSTIWTEKHKLLPQGIRVQKRGLQGEYPPHHESWRVLSKCGVLALTAPTLAFGLWPLFVCLFGLFVFLILNFVSCLYILEINRLSVASFAIVFSHSEGCFFILFIVSFAMQKILHLIRPHLFNLVLFVFFFSLI